LNYKLQITLGNVIELQITNYFRNLLEITNYKLRNLNYIKLQITYIIGVKKFSQETHALFLLFNCIMLFETVYLIFSKK